MALYSDEDIARVAGLKADVAALVARVADPTYVDSRARVMGAPAAHTGTGGAGAPGNWRPGEPVKALSLTGKVVGEEQAAALSAALARNTVLTSLNLSFNLVSDGSAAHIADALLRNTTLRELRYAHGRRRCGRGSVCSA